MTPEPCWASSRWRTSDRQAVPRRRCRRGRTARPHLPRERGARPGGGGERAVGAPSRRPAGHGRTGGRAGTALPGRRGRRRRPAGRRGTVKDHPSPHASQARRGTLKSGRSSTSPWPENPVLVEVWRSGFLESVHRGALVVLDAEGSVTFAAGAVDRPVLPRSSNKPVQATAFLEAGWTPRSTEELAIAAASHNGEDGHRDVVAGMLAAAGLS